MTHPSSTTHSSNSTPSKRNVFSICTERLTQDKVRRREVGGREREDVVREKGREGVEGRVGKGEGRVGKEGKGGWERRGREGEEGRVRKGG